MDLSNGKGSNQGNYVSVILKNLTTGATDWTSNRIQTTSKSFGRQIRDNEDEDRDITVVGSLVPGTADVYQYTFSSLMKVYELDKYVDASIVWILPE